MLKNADKIKMRTLILYFVHKNYRKLLWHFLIFTCVLQEFVTLIFDAVMRLPLPITGTHKLAIKLHNYNLALTFPV